MKLFQLTWSCYFLFFFFFLLEVSAQWQKSDHWQVTTRPRPLYIDILTKLLYNSLIFFKQIFSYNLTKIVSIDTLCSFQLYINSILCLNHTIESCYFARRMRCGSQPVMFPLQAKNKYSLSTLLHHASAGLPGATRFRCRLGNVAFYCECMYVCT